jgi:sugar/nucleoside kinase (ribokinase family)
MDKPIKSGLFVGLVTLDTIYLASDPPSRNQKIVARDFTVAAGGPATNAAVTFAHLGNNATLVGAVGCHPITSLVRADLAAYSVAIADLSPERPESLPVSSIVVTEATGDRAVISLNASRSQIPSARVPNEIWAMLQSEQQVDIVLVDGHQIPVGVAIASQARARGIPIVLDGGSWKPGLEELLPLIDYAICSSNFYPPGCKCADEAIAFLANLGILHIAVTNGAEPIRYLSQNRDGEIVVPQVKPIDTLGAGDIFHGAFCDRILHANFEAALTFAASVSVRACQFFGTRHWTTELWA